ncbi:MAG: hypothetical protein ACRD4R_02270 [Candidatus Acidiferrales bacterium]
MSDRLSPETQRRIEALFTVDKRTEATELLLHECGNNLPSLQNLDEFQLERFRFAALKLSEGSIEKLRLAIKLAKADWRDLLVAAGFRTQEDHKQWFPSGHGQ